MEVLERARLIHAIDMDYTNHGQFRTQLFKDVKQKLEFEGKSSVESWLKAVKTHMLHPHSPDWEKDWVRKMYIHVERHNPDGGKLFFDLFRHNTEFQDVFHRPQAQEAYNDLLTRNCFPSKYEEAMMPFYDLNRITADQVHTMMQVFMNSEFWLQTREEQVYLYDILNTAYVLKKEVQIEFTKKIKREPKFLLAIAHIWNIKTPGLEADNMGIQSSKFQNLIILKSWSIHQYIDMERPYTIQLTTLPCSGSYSRSGDSGSCTKRTHLGSKYS